MKDKTHLIPEGWKEMTLGETVNIIDGDRGSNYPKNNELLSNGFCLFLSTKNVPNTSFCFDEVKFINEKVHSKLRKGKLEKNDFVLTTRGTIGNFAYYSENTPYDHIRINSGMVVLRAKKELLENGFLEFFLKSGFFRKQVYSFSSGTAQPQLPIKDLRYIKMLLPPLPEQKAIAEVLSSFDNKIELLREQNKTLEAIAQTIFNEWFVRFNFPDENGKPYQASGGKMIDSELGPIPEGWRVGKMEEVVKICGGSTPDTTESSYWNGSINWTSPKDLSIRKELFLTDTENRITTDGLKQISSGLLPKGTLLLSSRAPIGYLAITDIPVAINQGYIAFLPNGFLSNEFMFFWLKNNLDQVIACSNGSTFLEISKASFKNIHLIIPKKQEMDHFQTFCSSFFLKILNNIYQVRVLERTRDLLLQKLLSGYLRVGQINEEIKNGI